MLTDLIAIFPNLANTPYLRTSPCEIMYNCFAWAAGDKTRRWDPSPLGPNYWPAGIERKVTRRNITRVYQVHGFAVCKDKGYEVGFEKIAIYIKGGRPTHAARLVSGDTWTSKIGDLDDIEHTLDGLSGDNYGKPTLFMRRKIMP